MKTRDITDEQRTAYATQWEKDHPGYSTTRFWEAYLRPDGLIEDTPQFNTDWRILGVQIPKEINFYDGFWSEPELSDEEIIQFIGTWLQNHPGITPDNFWDAYRNADGQIRNTEDSTKVEWYMDKYRKLTER